MTRNEAIERARAIFGPLANVEPLGIGSWLVLVSGRGPANVHALDAHGHVTCGHDACLVSERFADERRAEE